MAGPCRRSTDLEAAEAHSERPTAEGAVVEAARVVAAGAAAGTVVVMLVPVAFAGLGSVFEAVVMVVAGLAVTAVGEPAVMVIGVMAVATLVAHSQRTGVM